MYTMTMDARHHEPWFRRLFIPAYTAVEAARYAGTHPSTVASWHYRGTPLLPGHAHGTSLDYLELVEVAFVSFFRRMGFSLRRIRNTRDYLAKNFLTEYPLAQYVFKTEGMHILMEYNKFDPDPAIDQIIVADKEGQLAWTDLLGQQFAHFDYDYELAIRWYPAGRESLVVIDPWVGFGSPLVQGLPTWTIRGRWKADESVEEIMEEFELTKRAVLDALRFEGIDRVEEIAELAY